MSGHVAICTGYAAIFDIADAKRDVIRRGAFARAVASGRTVPVYWQHRPNMMIGVVGELREAAIGLFVRCGLDRLPEGLVPGPIGLSFGYRALNPIRTRTGRELTEIDLMEVSLVTAPMHPMARGEIELVVPA